MLSSPETLHPQAHDWKGEWPRVNPNAPCVVVILSSKHYITLRPPPMTPIPNLWLRRTKDPQDEELRGGGGSSTPSVCTLKTSCKKPTTSSKQAQAPKSFPENRPEVPLLLGLKGLFLGFLL